MNNSNSHSLDGGLSPASMYVYANPAVWVNANAINREIKVYYVDTNGNSIPGAEIYKPYTVTLGNTLTLTNADIISIPNYAYKEWRKGSGSPQTGSFPSPTLSAADVINNTDIYLVYEPDFIITYISNDVANGSYSHSAGFGSGEQPVTVKTLVETGFTPQPGTRFLGWNTRDDGKGTAYAPGATMQVSGNVTLYAQWEQANTTLTIAKRVAGDYGDKTKDFGFTVTFFDASGNPLPAETRNFTLKDGKSFPMEEISLSWKVCVEEAEDTNYSVTFVDSETPGVTEPGRITGEPRAMTEDRIITFTNTRKMVPETGIRLDGTGALILLPLLILMAFLVFLGAKYAHRRRQVVY